MHIHSTLASPYPETKTVEEWTSILRLATKWNFLSLRELAIERLFEITSPIDKIILSHTFHLPKWLPLAYARLCKRNAPLTIEEGRRLGELGPVGCDVVIRLWQACHEFNSLPVHQRMRNSAIDTVKRIFELDDSESGTSTHHECEDAVADLPIQTPAVPPMIDSPPRDCNEVCWGDHPAPFTWPAPAPTAPATSSNDVLFIDNSVPPDVLTMFGPPSEKKLAGKKGKKVKKALTTSDICRSPLPAASVLPSF